MTMDDPADSSTRAAVQDMDDNFATGKREVVHTYGWYLRKFVADTLAKRATPIVCSPVPRKAWRDGKIVTLKPEEIDV